MARAKDKGKNPSPMRIDAAGGGKPEKMPGISFSKGERKGKNQ